MTSYFESTSYINDEQSSFIEEVDKRDDKLLNAASDSSGSIVDTTMATKNSANKKNQNLFAKVPLNTGDYDIQDATSSVVSKRSYHNTADADDSDRKIAKSNTGERITVPHQDDESEQVNGSVKHNNSESSELNSVQVVTGANFSGKSVYLKQTALIVYMAHIGR